MGLAKTWTTSETGSKYSNGFSLKRKRRKSFHLQGQHQKLSRPVPPTECVSVEPTREACWLHDLQQTHVRSHATESHDELPSHRRNLV